MADKKITELNQLAQAEVNAADMAAVADVSANETRKVSIPDLAQAGVRLMPDGSMDGAKIEDSGIETKQLADEAVTAAKIDDGAVTTDKIADEAVTTAKIDDGAITSAKIGDGEVKLADLDSANYGRGLDKSADNVGITNSITGGTFAGITFTDQGLISAVDPDSTGDVPRADLPLATATEVGVSSVPATGGLAVTGTGELSIDNTVTGAQHTKITYDEHGLVTAGENIGPADLPIATTTTVGAVKVPATDGGADTPLDIGGDGTLTHADSGITAGTYEKITIDKIRPYHRWHGFSCKRHPQPRRKQNHQRHSAPPVLQPPNRVLIKRNTRLQSRKRVFLVVTSMTSLPPTSKRHSQQTTQFQEATQLSSVDVFGSKNRRASLYMYNGNAWHIVAGGQLTSENLRFCGTYDANTNVILTLTDEGAAEQDRWLDCICCRPSRSIL